MNKLIVWHPNEDIKVVKEFNTTEASRVLDLLTSVNGVLRVYQAKDSFSANYLSFLKLIEDVESKKVLPYLAKDRFQQEVQNILSSFRGYADNTAHTISRIYGNDTKISKEFERQKNIAFDNYKAYRFVDALRNYSQHRGDPISSLSVRERDGKTKVELLFRKELLLSSDKLSSKKKANINRSFDDDIDIVENMKLVFGIIILVHHRITALCYNDEVEKGNISSFFEFSRYLSSKDQMLMIADLVGSKDPQSMNFQGIPFSFIEMESLFEDLSESMIE